MTGSLFSFLWTQYEKYVKSLGRRGADQMPAGHYQVWQAKYLAGNPIIEVQFHADGYLVRLQSGELLLLSGNATTPPSVADRAVAITQGPKAADQASVESKAIQI